MGKGGGKQTVTQRPDAASQAFIDQMRAQAMQGAGVALGQPVAGPTGPSGPFAGFSASSNPLARLIGQVAERGGMTTAAAPAAPAAGAPASPESFFTGPLTQADIEAAMSPFLSGVVDATRGEFDFLRGQAGTQAAQEATGAGAFGGSRSAVLQGTRLGELDRAQASTIAQLMQSGFTDARQFAEHQRQLRERQLQEPLFRQQTALGFLNLGLGPVGSTTQQTATSGGLFGF